MKLFGFGNKSERRTAKVLGSHLTEIFGGEEGAEMIVEATESGLSAIEAAESRLEEYNQQVATLLGEKATAIAAQLEAESALTSSQDALAVEQAAHQETVTAFDAFKAESGDTHTTVEKDADDYNGGGAQQSQLRRDEAAAKAQGVSLSKHIKK
jgi:hypothetical protein